LLLSLWPAAVLCPNVFRKCPSFSKEPSTAHHSTAILVGVMFFPFSWHCNKKQLRMRLWQIPVGSSMEISPYGKVCLFVLCSTSIFTQKTYTLALTDTSTPLTLMAPNRVSTHPTNANKQPGAIEATEKHKKCTKEEIEHDKALEWA
jgi:hypothetical protein